MIVQDPQARIQLQQYGTWISLVPEPLRMLHRGDTERDREWSFRNLPTHSFLLSYICSDAIH